MSKYDIDKLIKDIETAKAENDVFRNIDPARDEAERAFAEKYFPDGKVYTADETGEPLHRDIRMQDGENTDTDTKMRMELYDWIQCFVTALICGVLIFIFIGRTIGVDGTSMLQTLKHTDRVIMHNIFYTPKKGDIIVFQSFNEDRFHDVPLVKRVIATAGDTIDIDFTNGDVIINGNVIYEPYINTITAKSEGFEGPVTIPEGYVFVMGDNRNSSIDSRSSDVGLVDTRYILGNVVFLLIPGGSGAEPRDWSRFGLVG